MGYILGRKKIESSVRVQTAVKLGTSNNEPIIIELYRKFGRHKMEAKI
jgi:hypothetical protein